MEWDLHDVLHLEAGNTSSMPNWMGYCTMKFSAVRFLISSKVKKCEKVKFLVTQLWIEVAIIRFTTLLSPFWNNRSVYLFVTIDFMHSSLYKILHYTIESICIGLFHLHVTICLIGQTQLPVGVTRSQRSNKARSRKIKSQIILQFITSQMPHFPLKIKWRTK